MNTTRKSATSSELESLHRALSKALEKKRRLGHYAVVWQDGNPVRIGEDAPDSAVAS